MLMPAPAQPFFINLISQVSLNSELCSSFMYMYQKHSSFANSVLFKSNKKQETRSSRHTTSKNLTGVPKFGFFLQFWITEEARTCPAHSMSIRGLSTVVSCTRFRSLTPQNRTCGPNTHKSHKCKTMLDFFQKLFWDFVLDKITFIHGIKTNLIIHLQDKLCSILIANTRQRKFELYTCHTVGSGLFFSAVL